MVLTPLLVPEPAGPLGWPVAAVLLAVSAAVLFGLATVRQHAAVERLAGAGDLGDLRQLVRAPGWLAGAAQSLVAGSLHLGALALAPVALVQPLGVLAVPVAVVAHARTAGRRPAPTSLVAALLSVLGTAGLTLTLLLAPPADVEPTLPGLPTVALLPVAALLVPLLGLIGSSAPVTRAAASALTGAVLFGITSVLVRAAATAWTTGHAVVGLTAVVGAVLLAGVGGVSVQRAYRTGSPALVVCCLTLLDPLVATAGAAALLHEAPALTVATAGGAVLGFVLAAGGVLLLSRDHPGAVPPRPSSPPEPIPPTRLGVPQPTARPTLTRSPS
ncbi:hypothetical protein SAMN04488543_2043 [Friedmanniella luteola]|uniref:Magnesium transporter NIPA n=1 Tax=Friedmanniella luteola TaxID=546871 RepID=A0A1H1TKA2_9ACTN|nr:hypothetical protein [Friedmanniella luteola]SDS60604.1 hypothetical protein SAMN04488543_2043 [Friedmanniella luteola]